jgi:hypothetical protein
VCPDTGFDIHNLICIVAEIKIDSMSSWIPKAIRGRRGSDSMVVGFTTT